jgi:hypothetical protein
VARNSRTFWRPEVNYRVTIGGQKLELTADVARRIWDEWPEQQRTGKREAAFILWGLDRLGCRCAPVICKPITAKAH